MRCGLVLDGNYALDEKSFFGYISTYMKLDRLLQLEILEFLRNAYPQARTTDNMSTFKKHEYFFQNMLYLEQHGLIKDVSGRNVHGGWTPNELIVKITEKGLDFLEDDGGVSAILKTVTVKFDPDDLCKLLLIKLDKLDIPTEKKDSIISTIKKAPADALKTLYTKLINIGLDKASDVFDLIKEL